MKVSFVADGTPRCFSSRRGSAIFSSVFRAFDRFPGETITVGGYKFARQCTFSFFFFLFLPFLFFLSPFSPPLSFSLFPPRIFLRAFPLYTRRCCTAGSLFFPLFLLLMTRARKNARGKQQRSDRHSRQRAFAGETVDSDRF